MSRWLLWASASVIGLILAARLLDFAQHSWNMLFFPWQLDFDEGVNANASWLLSRGNNIYAPNPPGHFVSALYPPLYYTLNAGAMRLWGLNLWSGRLLTVASSLAAGAALWAWVYSETKRHAAGIVAALLWFSLGPVYVWGSFYKQDIPAIALGLVGMAWVARSPRPPAVYWAIAPLSLSFWMKQSSVAPLAAVGLFLLLRDWRLAVRWGLAAVGSIIVPFVILNALTEGGLYAHLFAFNLFERSVPRFTQRLDMLWSYHAPLVVGGAVSLAVAIVWSIVKRRSPALSLLYLLVSIPVTALAILHPTGNYNHLLNILAPLCLSVGVTLGWAWGRLEGARARSQWAWASLAVGVLLLVGVQLVLTYSKPVWTWYTPLALPLDERGDRMVKLSELVKQTPGDLLSENSWLLLKNGKRVLYDDPVAMSALANAGAWDQSVLLQDLNRRKFPMILLEYDLTNDTYNPRWSEQALRAIQSNYTLTSRDLLFVYTPRPPATTPETSARCAVENGPTLEGYTFRAATANRGDTLLLSLYWRGAGRQASDLKYFVRLADASGTPKWQADLHPGEWAGKPQQGAVHDDIPIPIPNDLPYGHYQLLFGVYSVGSGGQIAPVGMSCAGGLSPNQDRARKLTDIEVVER